MRNMRTINRLIIAIICLAAVGCQSEEEALRYNNITMGNFMEGTFISDQGNIFNVVENPCKGDLTANERSFIICDVLDKSRNGRDNEYDIRLTHMTKVLAKDIVTPDAETDDDIEIEDPVKIEDIWAAGGYINMYVIFPVKLGSSTPHIINLVQEESGEEGVYSFTLRHNAQGETVDDINTTNLGFGGGYVSFPVNAIMKEEQARIQIRWKWYKQTVNGFGSETEYKFIDKPYTKTGYEHVTKNTGK